MIKVGIAGASGFTGGELIRVLINHPKVDIVKFFTTSHAGQKIWEVHKELYGETSAEFTDNDDFSDLDILFLCLPHGASREFLTNVTLHDNLKIIDFGSDFRLREASEIAGRHFVYGLSEAFGTQIAGADNIANPGCFATAIQLSLLPLAANNLITKEININAVTGSTGAGATLNEYTGFNKRYSNFSTYNQFTHRHIHEITETVHKFQPDFPGLNFIPARGGFTRGIYCAAFTEISDSQEIIEELFKEYYLPSPFVHVVDFEPELKMVVNTNKCFINVRKFGEKVLVTAVIDNLLKGAAGQAVQNMNLMYGFSETLGLKLKSVAY